MSTSHIANHIATCAIPANSTVRRSPSCSGEYNYKYKNQFRVFKFSTRKYAENLVKDYEDYMNEGNPIFSNYYAIAALHHEYTSRSVSHFMKQNHIVEQLNTISPSSPSSLSSSSSHPRYTIRLQRQIKHIQREQSIRHIQRPLTDATLSIAHEVVRDKVTELSALHPHQRLRTTAGSLIALLALRLCCERTTQRFVDSNEYGENKLHHNGIQHILRRASGSKSRINQIAEPYTKYADKLSKNIPENLHTTLKRQMVDTFDKTIPVIETPHGPYEFHKAEYFANKCIELIGNPGNPDNHDQTSDPLETARWSELSAKVQRVRRGEITAYDVLTDPSHNNWVFSLHYTYVHAIKYYLAANNKWNNIYIDTPPDDTETANTANTANTASAATPDANLFWENSHEIRKNATLNVQMALMVRAMYRFIIRASRIISPEFIGVFGLNDKFVKSIISRIKMLATYNGDEASALLFAHLLPCLMTPNVHLDIYVGWHSFQTPELYVKMSDPVLGEVKKKFRDVIPSRHTGVIDRATLM